MTQYRPPVVDLTCWDKAQWLAWAVHEQVVHGELDAHVLTVLFDAGAAHGRASALTERRPDQRPQHHAEGKSNEQP